MKNNISFYPTRSSSAARTTVTSTTKKINKNKQKTERPLKFKVVRPGNPRTWNIGHARGSSSRYNHQQNDRQSDRPSRRSRDPDSNGHDGNRQYYGKGRDYSSKLTVWGQLFKTLIA